MLGSRIINSEVEPTFYYGNITGQHYDMEHPTEIHDTEEDAINWAYNKSKYANWIIVPIITFDE